MGSSKVRRRPVGGEKGKGWRRAADPAGPFRSPERRAFHGSEMGREGSELAWKLERAGFLPVLLTDTPQAQNVL